MHNFISKLVHISEIETVTIFPDDLTVLGSANNFPTFEAKHVKYSTNR